MSNVIEVPFGNNASETATLLLAAAEELGRDASEVRTTAGAFLVPEEIVEQVGAERPEEPPTRRRRKSAAAAQEE
jgi:hypothetical protein